MTQFSVLSVSSLRAHILESIGVAFFDPELRQGPPDDRVGSGHFELG